MTRLGRTEFLAALSHELRTPLNSILGFTQVLLSELDGPLTEAQREDLGAIETAGSYLSALVRDVLDTSAEETAELELFGRLDLRGIATAAVRLFEPEARRSGMSFEVAVDASTPRPVGSARAVRQVLLNLLGNAVKHGLPGRIRIASSYDADVVELRVSNAVRATPTLAAAPFAPFSRGSDHLESWGLGLAIATEIAARMGGAIRASNGFTGGQPTTMFALCMPLQPGVRLGPDPSETSMPTRTHFVAAMSHELRTPLGSIAGFAQLLEEEIDGPLTDAQRQSVQRIRASAEGLVASLTDILDTAKADVGRLTLRPFDQTLGALFEDLVEGARRTVEGREHYTAVIATPPPAPSTYVQTIDPKRFTQAGLALVRHALDTGTPGALELTMRIGLVHATRMLRFEVKDPARHLGAAEAEAAFDAFGELHDPSGRRILGLGLKLALARVLARLHGGDAWCETTHATVWVLAVPLEATDD